MTTLKKLKKKNLTQAVILGLLLAVPLGAQATEYTEPIKNISDSSLDTYDTTPNSKGEYIRIDNADGKTHTYQFAPKDKLIVKNEQVAVEIRNIDRSIKYDLTSLKHIELRRKKQ